VGKSAFLISQVVALTTDRWLADENRKEMSRNAKNAGRNKTGFVFLDPTIYRQLCRNPI
jgi:hypothetical protein